MPQMPKFEAHELEVLEAVVDSVPNLRAVARAALLVRKHCKYPIKAPNELEHVFAGKPHVDLDDRHVTHDEANLFIPDAFFPIESERELIHKLLIAFQIGDVYHHTEGASQVADNDDVPMTVLPGPTFHKVTKKDLVRAKRKVV